MSLLSLSWISYFLATPLKKKNKNLWGCGLVAVV
jgi:hypothetical protein